MAEEEEYKAIPLTQADVAYYSKMFGYEEHKLHQYRDAFSVFDLDRDGIITVSELIQVLVSLGYRPSADEVATLVKTVDRQKRDWIDFTSFLHLLSRTVGVDHNDELRDVFGVFDNNSDGFISSGELHSIMTRLGVKTSMEEAEEMIKEADVNEDGLVDFEEFNKILTSQEPNEHQPH